jgi:hypothetical protein
MMRWQVISIVAAIGLVVFGGAPRAHALTMKECSAKYQAALQAGTLHGMKWNEFRKAECGAGGPGSSGGSAAPSPSNASAPSREAPAGFGNAVFPTAVSPKYSREPAGKARMHTCLDQYNANKAGNANGGLHWIQKSGGYYSQCNKRLKGQSIG